MFSVKKFTNALENSVDVALYSYIFERRSNSFSVGEIQSELRERGVEIETVDLKERLSRFVDLGFLVEEYRVYVRCD